MTETVDLAPARFATLVAPAITRIFYAGMRASGDDGRELVASHGGRAVGYLIDLRNPLAAGRRLTPADLAVVYRYTESDEVRETVQRSVEHGLVDQTPDGAVAASERGHAFLRDLFALHGRVLSERWGGGHRTERVDRLNGLLARVLAEATATGGAAWAVQSPPHDPAGTPPAVLLLNRLAAMRYHRADAHAAAWHAAGLTAPDMTAMPWGTRWSPDRQKIEDDTNQRDAPPYAVLTADERLTLLADLAALP